MADVAGKQLGVTLASVTILEIDEATVTVEFEQSGVPQMIRELRKGDVIIVYAENKEDVHLKQPE